ncbi:MAG: 30S ribosomal protein S16 [Parcubacteria group bacterium]|nr:30S ribosomal protein S16 [Parcubacteria group bacterium]
MIKIRLQRVGKRNRPSYRLVVIEDATAPKGRALEIVGYYNPILKTGIFQKDRVEYWFIRGAQLSRTAHNLLVSRGIIPGPKKPIPIPRPIVPHEVAAAPTAQPPAAESEIADTESPASA